MVNEAMLRGFRLSIWRLTVVIALFVVADAHAKMIKLRIELDRCYRVPGDLNVVLNGDEKEQPHLTPDVTHKTWTGEWRDKRDVPFPEGPVFASARLGFARTNCESATQEKDDEGGVVAVFHFRCDVNPVRQLSITIEPMPQRRPIRASYKRTLATSQGSDCQEQGDFEGTGDVHDLRFPSEMLTLQLHPRIPDLSIFDSSVKKADAPARSIFDPGIRQYRGWWCTDDPSALCLDRGKVVDAVEAQRHVRSNPSSYTNTKKTLESLGLARLKLKVE